jgi:hypothetical protein
LQRQNWLFLFQDLLTSYLHVSTKWLPFICQSVWPCPSCCVNDFNRSIIVIFDMQVAHSTSIAWISVMIKVYAIVSHFCLV